MGRLVNRRAATLVEILVALALFAGLSGALFVLYSSGFTGSVKAEHSQLASQILARVTDSLVALGYRDLKTLGGTTRSFTWSEDKDLVVTGQTPMPGSLIGPPPPTVGAREIAGTYRVDPLDPGLLKVTVSVALPKTEGVEDPRRPLLVAVRFVADPAHGMEPRPVAGGAP